MSKHIIKLQGEACKGASFLHAIEYAIINNSGLNQNLNSHSEMGLRMPHAVIEKIAMDYVVNNDSDQTSQQADLSEASVISIELGRHFYKSAVLQFDSQEEVCFSGMSLYNESIEG